MLGYSIPAPEEEEEEDNFGIGVEWLDVYDKMSRGNQYAIALQDNLSWPLHFASGRGHLKDVRDLLNSQKVHVNDRNADGETSLVLATKSDKCDVVRELITHENVDFNVCGSFGYTVLIWATLKGELEVVSTLLKHDTLDTNLKNIAGLTALDIAHNCGHEAIATLLWDNNKAITTKRMKMTPMIP